MFRRHMQSLELTSSKEVAQNTDTGVKNPSLWAPCPSIYSFESVQILSLIIALFALHICPIK